jgi:hypothetical protein
MIRRALSAAMLFAGLAGCGTSATDIANGVEVEFIRSAPNPLKHAVALGNVTGGDLIGSPFGLHITSVKFAELMTIVLQRNSLLAEPGQERYRLEIALDYDTRVAQITAKAIDASVHYALRDKATGEIVFEKTVATAGTAQYSGYYPFGAPGYVPLSVAGISSASGSTQRKADENATLANLNEFMPAFGEWIRHNAPKSDPAS